MQAFKKVSTKPLTEWLVIIHDKPGVVRTSSQYQ